MGEEPTCYAEVCLKNEWDAETVKADLEEGGYEVMYIRLIPPPPTKEDGAA